MRLSSMRFPDLLYLPARPSPRFQLEHRSVAAQQAGKQAAAPAIVSSHCPLAIATPLHSSDLGPGGTEARKPGGGPRSAAPLPPAASSLLLTCE